MIYSNQRRRRNHIFLFIGLYLVSVGLSIFLIYQYILAGHLTARSSSMATEVNDDLFSQVERFHVKLDSLLINQKEQAQSKQIKVLNQQVKAWKEQQEPDQLDSRIVQALLTVLETRIANPQMKNAPSQNFKQMSVRRTNLDGRSYDQLLRQLEAQERQLNKIHAYAPILENTISSFNRMDTLIRRNWIKGSNDEQIYRLFQQNIDLLEDLQRNL